MSDLSDYLVGQIAQTTRSQESAIRDLQKSVDTYGEKLEEVSTALEHLTTWAQRLAVLSCLWGGAVGLNLAPEKVAEIASGFLQHRSQK